MASTHTSRSAFDIPRLVKLIKTDSQGGKVGDDPLWDVCFYPYDNGPSSDPIFAVGSRKLLCVYRLSNADNSLAPLRFFQTKNTDGQDAVEHYVSCCWCYIDQDQPLLLGAGDAGSIRVFNVLKNELMTTLVEHGQGTINDMATHPLYPWIFVTCSEDTSLRIWDLRRWDEKYQPKSVIICGSGHGHSESILSVSWHDKGRYIISSGHDHRICVWAIPDLAPQSSFWEEISPSQRKRRSDEIRIIHHPHFITSAIHHNYVDCVRFWGDLVISKSAGPAPDLENTAPKNSVVIWSMVGFNSSMPVASSRLAPKTEEHLDTRNGFMLYIDENPSTGASRTSTRPCYEGRHPYIRLLEMEVRSCYSFFMRFELLKPSSMHQDLHPMIALGNQAGQVYFWDLQAVASGQDLNPSKKADSKKSKKSRLQPPPPRFRDGSSTPSLTHRSSSHMTMPSTPLTVASTPPSSISGDASSGPPLPEPDRERFPLSNPHSPITKAPHIVDLGDYKSHLYGRTTAWSPDGRWCVVVGSMNEEYRTKDAKTGRPVYRGIEIGAMAILRRW